MNGQRTREGVRGQCRSGIGATASLLARVLTLRNWLAEPAKGRCPRRFITSPATDTPTASQPPRPSAGRPALAHSPGSATNKGVHILLRAVRQVRAEGFTAFSVDLNGDNLKYAPAPVREAIEAFLADERERPPDEQLVTLNGSYHVDELASRMARMDWCIVPSTWWEIFGLVISEAWMFGKPVICSNVGGPGERVVDEVGGLHFQLRDHRLYGERRVRSGCGSDCGGGSGAASEGTMIHDFCNHYASERLSAAKL